MTAFLMDRESVKTNREGNMMKKIGNRIVLGASTGVLIRTKFVSDGIGR